MKHELDKRPVKKPRLDGENDGSDDSKEYLLYRDTENEDEPLDEIDMLCKYKW